MQVVGSKVGEAAGLAGSLHKCLKSSCKVHQGCGAWMGTSQELVVVKGDSTRTIDTTTYWSNWRTSMTMSVLSHLLGCGPVWF